MIYSVRHITTFRYEPAVRESVMEVRMQPRSEGGQRCFNFQLKVDPGASVMQYTDFMGNTVHHFDIAGTHPRIQITARAMVEVQMPPLPHVAASGDWDELDALVSAEDHWEMLLPSQFAKPSEELDHLAKELAWERRAKPLLMLMDLNRAIYEKFAYVPNSTKVDSPIAEALASRRGVCQDFAHVMIALGRQLGIPCRYVSGYLFHGEKDRDRSPEGATHAWVEALVPEAGWVAFDPTNNLLGSERHIRVALGRDYADVPPTRGVYKGEANSELSVSVTVVPANDALPEESPVGFMSQSRPILVHSNPRAAQEQQQQ